jgi:hypothetical protein
MLLGHALNICDFLKQRNKFMINHAALSYVLTSIFLGSSSPLTYGVVWNRI